MSAVGAQNGSCSRTAPCKTFAGAISKTAASGEIDALDPGGFGAVTITKAITLDGHGTFASILVAGTAGITVNAGATDTVVSKPPPTTTTTPGTPAGTYPFSITATAGTVQAAAALTLIVR